MSEKGNEDKKGSGGETERSGVIYLRRRNPISSIRHAASLSDIPVSPRQEEETHMTTLRQNTKAECICHYKPVSFCESDEYNEL